MADEPMIVTPGEMVKRTSRSLSGLSASDFAARRLAAQNGQKVTDKPKLLAQNLRLHNKNQYGIALLTFDHPLVEVAMAFAPMEARQLAAALEEHARLLDEYAAAHPDGGLMDDSQEKP